jgi:hypothetical protein
MSFCWLAGVIRKPCAGRHEDDVENYICSSCLGGAAKRAASGVCGFAKNIRFYQVGVGSRKAGHQIKPVVYCCFKKWQRSLAVEKQAVRFAQDDGGGMRWRLPTTDVFKKLKNHRDLPWSLCRCNTKFTKYHRFSQGFSGSRDAPHKSAPCRPATLQIHDAARNLLTSLGVRRHGVPFGEKNPWNLMRIMPPQGSVELSPRRFFPPFLRSLFMERT